MLPNQIKFCNNVKRFKIEFDDFRKKCWERELKKAFWELSDELR